MQRTAPDHGIIISCDFCGTDWDPATGLPPMTEGHHGSVLCLTCLQRALDQRAALPGPFRCTLCLKEELPETLPRWHGSPKVNPPATVCEDCILQAAKVFDRDPEVEWKWKRGKS